MQHAATKTLNEEISKKSMYNENVMSFVLPAGVVSLYHYEGFVAYFVVLFAVLPTCVVIKKRKNIKYFEKCVDIRKFPLFYHIKPYYENCNQDMLVSLQFEIISALSAMSTILNCGTVVSYLNLISSKSKGYSMMPVVGTLTRKMSCSVGR